MKRRVALLLALVMAVSILPMNVFGVRPGTITEMNSPSDDVNIFRLDIDAAALSQRTIPIEGNLYLDFTVSGEDAGFRIFAKNEEITELVNGTVRGTGRRPFPYTNRADDSYTGHTGRLAFRMTSGNVAPVALSSGSSLVAQQTAAAARDALAAFDMPGVTGAQTTGTQATVPNQSVVGSGDALSMTGTNINPVVEQVLAQASGRSEWEGMFTSGTRLRLPGDRGYRGNNAIGGSPNFRDTVPMEHWKTIRMPIAGVETGWGEIPAGETSGVGFEDMTPTTGGGRRWQTVEFATGGWFHVDLPIVAPAPGATLRVRLMSTTSAGRPGLVQDLGTYDLSGGFGGGVNFESRGVVPMTNIARLNAIRITEASLGSLTDSHNGGGLGTVGANHIVKIAAPRGFRWDTGAMRGIIHGDGIYMRGNPTVFGLGANVAQIDPITGIFTPNWDGRALPAAGMNRWPESVWLNPVTDRHEIYVHIYVPPRVSNSIAARTTLAWVDIEGLILIPVAGAPTTGDVAVDIWMGTTRGTNNDWFQHEIGVAIPDAEARNTNWGTNGDNPRHMGIPQGTEVFLLGTTLPDGRVRQTRFGWFGENDASGSRPPAGYNLTNYSATNIVVANLDNEAGITVTAGTVAELVSGRVNTTLNSSGSDRYLVGSGHSIRLTENMPRSMFHNFDRYEFRAAQPGVHFVDARFRIGNEDGSDYVVGWTNPFALDAGQDSDDFFVTTLTTYDGGSLFIAPRTLDHDEEGRLRTMDVQMMLSVEAGFEANYNTGQVEIEVYRNDEFIGTAVVANVKDPVRLTREGERTVIDRDRFDVIPLTEVGNLIIEETEVGHFRNNDEIWLHLQATQDGRPVSIPDGMLSLFVGDYEVNEAESSMTIEPLRGGAGFEPQSFRGDEIRSRTGYRVIRPSANVPGIITISGLYVAGPTVPGLEWHVVVTGADRSYRGTAFEPDAGNLNYGYQGLTPNSHRFFPANLEEDSSNKLEREQYRARIFELGYNQTILEVTGFSDINKENIENNIVGPELTPLRASFSENSVSVVDGAEIKVIEFVQVAEGVVSTMINPRVFADFIGSTGEWNDATREYTFSGTSTLGDPVTVVLTLDSPTIRINNQAFDIAERANQPSLRGRVSPQVVNNRQYVPVRVLAEAFSIPFVWDAGSRTITLG